MLHVLHCHIQPRLRTLFAVELRGDRLLHLAAKSTQARAGCRYELQLHILRAFVGALAVRGERGQVEMFCIYRVGR